VPCVLSIAGVGWDAGRPVPWRRLAKEWLVYAAIMTVVFAFLFRGQAGLWPIIGGLVASGPLYLGLGYVLAKFGYQRKTLAELRTPRASAPEPADTRSRPAPTRRTSTGPNRPSAKSRKR
jgi:hypothetical protein